MREPLRHRPFRLLFLAQCASFLGDAVFLVALAFAVIEVSGTASALGLVLGVGSVALIATFLVSGVWADRLPRLRVMVASDLVRVASQATLATLLITERAELWHLVALNAVYSMATAFFMPARTGITPQLLEPRLLMSGNGAMATAENLIWMVGFAFGGILVAAIGVGWAIAIDAATFVVSAAFLLAIGRVPPSAPAADRQPFLRELGDGWREMTSRRWLWFVILNATVFLLVYEAPLQVVGPLTMDDAYDGSRSWGFALSAMGGGAMVGAFLSATHRLRRPILWALGAFFACALVPVMLLVEAPLLALAATFAVVGLGFGLFDTVWESTVQSRVPADKVSRVSAWDWMGSMAGMPLGFALAGVLVESVGRTATLASMAVGTFLICVVFVLDRDVRSLGAELAPGGETDVPVRDSAGSTG
ncbi:MAG: major facilitator superfamily 1 [Thermoleophilia bacterium]|nr:major facilitator superfamily 1 [Thermoleophilia bacterium]